jgi:hypothetical protein
MMEVFAGLSAFAKSVANAVLAVCRVETSLDGIAHAEALVATPAVKLALQGTSSDFFFRDVIPMNFTHILRACLNFTQ